MEKINDLIKKGTLATTLALSLGTLTNTTAYAAETNNQEQAHSFVSMISQVTEDYMEQRSEAINEAMNKYHNGDMTRDEALNHFALKDTQAVAKTGLATMNWYQDFSPSSEYSLDPKQYEIFKGTLNNFSAQQNDTKSFTEKLKQSIKQYNSTSNNTQNNKPQF